MFRRSGLKLFFLLISHFCCSTVVLKMPDTGDGRQRFTRSQQMSVDEIINRACEKQSEMVLERLDARLDVRFADINVKLDGLTKRLAENEGSMSVCERRIDAAIAKLNELEIKREDSERYSRLNNLRFYGLPEEKNENVEQLVLQLIADKLKINITSSDIQSSHRVGSGEKRAIIVRFISFKIRSEIYTKKKLFKGTSIIVREDLTQHKVKLLRLAVGRFGSGKVWTSNCRVYVSTGNGRREVTSPDDFGRSAE